MSGSGANCVMDAAAEAEPTGAMAERRAHHTVVHELLTQGAGSRQIARHLGSSPRLTQRAGYVDKIR
jgi:hypothetical protein